MKLSQALISTATITFFVGTTLSVAYASGKSSRGRGCTNDVIERLTSQGVKRSDITGITTRATVAAGGEGGLQGFSAWVTLASCPKGYVIVDYSTSCYIEQVYTRDGCEVESISDC